MKRLPLSVLIFPFIVAVGTPTFGQMPGSRPAPAAAMVAAAASKGHTEVFEWVNLGILIAFLIYVLRKPVSQFFNQRLAAIRDGLEEGRKALAAAQAQMAVVEEKLRRLDQEVASLNTSAMEEIKAEAERMRRTSEQETARILEAAGHSIASATLSAKLELKNFAARQASELAEKMIRDRLDLQAQAQLVGRFLESLSRARHADPPA